MGRYDKTEPRYRILSQIPGDNAGTAERQVVPHSVMQNHLAVLEFCADKVRKIIEPRQ